jgi:hypothetical protein
MQKECRFLRLSSGSRLNTPRHFKHMQKGQPNKSQDDVLVAVSFDQPFRICCYTLGTSYTQQSFRPKKVAAPCPRHARHGTGSLLPRKAG